MRLWSKELQMIHDTKTIMSELHPQPRRLWLLATVKDWARKYSAAKGHDGSLDFIPPRIGHIVHFQAGVVGAKRCS